MLKFHSPSKKHCIIASSLGQNIKKKQKPLKTGCSNDVPCNFIFVSSLGCLFIFVLPLKTCVTSHGVNLVPTNAPFFFANFLVLSGNQSFY